MAKFSPLYKVSSSHNVLIGQYHIMSSWRCELSSWSLWLLGSQHCSTGCIPTVHIGLSQMYIGRVTIWLRWVYSYHRMGSWKGHSPKSWETCFYSSIYYCLCITSGNSLYLSELQMLLFKDRGRSWSRWFPLSQSVFHREMIWWDTTMLVTMPFCKNEASGNPCDKWICLTF